MATKINRHFTPEFLIFCWLIEMAESVQYYMELMVPELKDLEEKKIFTSEEIKSIVKKRQDFEYRLKRRAPLKSDYLQYIHYELALESLRVKRKKKLNIKSTTRTISDHSGLKRLHFLFDRVTNKFCGDKSLWLDYISFAKKARSYKHLSKVFAKAIRFHPRDSTFWRMAAEFEWEEHGSAVTSRAIFQRGLRINSDDEGLWLAYFKMELMFLAKLLLRREILAEKITESGAEILKVKTDEASEVANGQEDMPETLKSSKEEAVFSGAIPLSVVQHGLKKVKNTSRFLEGVNEILESVQSIDQLKDAVVNISNGITN
jgi:hypothetical protein